MLEMVVGDTLQDRNFPTYLLYSIFHMAISYFIDRIISNPPFHLHDVFFCNHVLVMDMSEILLGRR